MFLNSGTTTSLFVAIKDFLKAHDDYGGTYVTEAPEVEVKQIWLCNVMHFVFDGEHPEMLYVRFE